jgi:oleate hydratase
VEILCIKTGEGKEEKTIFKGYDQFAGCLPVPIGAPLKGLLASVPSAGVAGRSFSDEIGTDCRVTPKTQHKKR